MRTGITTKCIGLGLAIALGSCGKSEPRSIDYFQAHIEEAEKIATGCRDGSVRGDECGNAGAAIAEKEARERFQKFIGK